MKWKTYFLLKGNYDYLNRAIRFIFDEFHEDYGLLEYLKSKWTNSFYIENMYSNVFEILELIAKKTKRSTSKL